MAIGELLTVEMTDLWVLFVSLLSTLRPLHSHDQTSQAGLWEKSQEVMIKGRRQEKDMKIKVGGRGGHERLKKETISMMESLLRASI